MPTPVPSSQAHDDLYETVEEYGRTFLRTKKYSLPNDAQEQDRLDVQHAMCLEILGNRLALAPVDDKPLENVLDLATGTGIWAMEYAKRHPSTKVVGTDLSRVDEQGKPSNCTFLIADADEDWNSKRHWNFIHARAILTCFTDPKSIIQKAYDNLAPGGYLELQDPILPWKFASPPPENSAFVRWNELSIEASIKGGRPWNNVQHYPRWFKEVGFEEVTESNFFVPTGTWTDDPRYAQVGTWQMLNLNMALEGWTFRTLERLGWKAEETQKLVDEVKEELQSGGLKSYTTFSVVYGRKPMVSH
ncbi:hypothetical protein AAFC00_006064 [Neodothiora populina]|uniref:S-adenosyl-L-methionine-dependent methyltransferase n=1 Tax=Neodothiora populina TaxID=2781224 RepID=A0ABR3P6Z0_9PEZI